MTTLITDILGDYRAFFADLGERLAGARIDIRGRAVSHLAFRTETVDEYAEVRGRLEPLCSAVVENTWNGRPIGKLLLARPLDLGTGHQVSLIELIPPVHRQAYPMGLEHVGIVIGEAFDEFRKKYDDVLTGRQDQGPYCQPVYITFENHLTVKFYRHALKDVVEMEGRPFTPRAQVLQASD